MPNNKPQTITYTVEFTLTDYEKLKATYPNFRYNYVSFSEFVRFIVADMKSQMLSNFVKGVKVKIKKQKREML